MRTLKYEEALALLVNEAEAFGIDLVVNNPARFLIKNMSVGYGRALAFLKELEVRGLISLYYQGNSGAIAKVVIKKKEAPERFYEVSEEKRLIGALWQFRRQSQTSPSLYIVHSLVFGDVRGLANIQNGRFYGRLGVFEKKGWIQYFKSSSNKILYITLTEKFPAP